MKVSMNQGKLVTAESCSVLARKQCQENNFFLKPWRSQKVAPGGHIIQVLVGFTQVVLEQRTLNGVDVMTH